MLGTPIGPEPFLQLQLAPTLGKLSRFCRAVLHLRDPQVALMLLRQSLGICRVTHILRTVDTTLIFTALEALDDMYLNVLRSLISDELTPDSWEQAGLPTRHGGLGLTHCLSVAPLAYVASVLTFSDKCLDLKLPQAARLPSAALRNVCNLLSPTLCPAVAVLLQAVSNTQMPLQHCNPEATSQKWWSSFVHSKCSRELLSRASARDRVRLQSLSAPLSGSWLTALPSSQLGLSFSPQEFQALMKWRLGLPIIPIGQHQCPFCGEVMDNFGDHSTCCAKSNLTARHTCVVNAIARVLKSVALDVTTEVAILGRQRPADLLIKGLSWPEPDALDVTVVNPMSDFDNPQAAERVDKAEENKHKKYDDICGKAKVKMNAFGMSVLGGVGPEASRFLGLVREKLLQQHGDAEGKTLANEAVQRISVACQRAVAGQLLKSMGGLWVAPSARPFEGAPSEGGEERKGEDPELC